MSIAHGARAGERLVDLSSRDRPTAVFCANDLLALGLLQSLTSAGIRVPAEIAIVGYDGGVGRGRPRMRKPRPALHFIA